MTHSFQTAVLQSPIAKANNCKKSHRSVESNKLFQVEITDFENECYTIEVEAKDFSEASEKAEALFFGDIYNMNIYELQ